VKLDGSGSVNVDDSVEGSAISNALVNYSDPNWRLFLALSGSYRKLKTEYDGVEENYDVFTVGGQLIVARSVSKHWSVAAIVSLNHDPTLNIDVDGSATIGVEWVLLPFLKTNDESISVRYIAGVEQEKFVSPNILNREQMSFLVHQISGEITKHWKEFDLSANAGASGTVNDRRFYNCFGSGSATWRITSRLSLTQSVYGRYQGASVSEPLVDDPSSSLEDYFTRGSFSNWTFNGSLSLQYTFGNSSLNSSDQRWN
jgi:hypothetical protein